MRKIIQFQMYPYGGENRLMCLCEDGSMWSSKVKDGKIEWKTYPISFQDDEPKPRLWEQYHELASSYDKLAEDYDKAQTRIEDLKAQLALGNARTGELRELINRKDDGLQSLLNKIEKMKSEYQNLTYDYDKVQVINESKELRISGLEARIKKMEEESETLRVMLAEKQKNIEDLCKLNAQLEREGFAAKIRMRELEKNVHLGDKDNNDLLSENERLLHRVKDYDEVFAHNAELKAKNEKFAAHINQMEKEVERYKAMLEATRNELNVVTIERNALEIESRSRYNKLQDIAHNLVLANEENVELKAWKAEMCT